jgi:hypothetical protein
MVRSLIATLLGLIVAPLALGQALVLEIDTGPDGTIDHVDDLALIDPGWSPGEIRLRAVIETPSGDLDITELCDWESSDPSVVTGGAPGEFFIVESGRVSLSARYSTLSSAPFEVNITVGEAIEDGAPPLAPLGPSDPVSHQTLRSRIGNLVGALEQSGVVEEGSLSSAHARITYHDNSGTSGFAGRPILKEGGGAQAVWLSSGTSINLNVVSIIPPILEWDPDFDTPIVRSEGEAIVFQSSVAQAIANGALLGPTGSMSSIAKLVIQELLHSVFNEAEIEADRETEERVVEEFEGLIGRLTQVSWLLDQDSLTNQQRVHLRSHLNAIREHIESLIELLGELEADRILRLLGLEDSDGNGLPDVVDQWLRDAGIDESDLPGPGGGPGWEIEDPCPPIQELPDQGDPCQGSGGGGRARVALPAGSHERIGSRAAATMAVDRGLGPRRGQWMRLAHGWSAPGTAERSVAAETSMIGPKEFCPRS